MFKDNITSMYSVPMGRCRFFTRSIFVAVTLLSRRTTLPLLALFAGVGVLLFGTVSYGFAVAEPGASAPPTRVSSAGCSSASGVDVIVPSHWRTDSLEYEDLSGWTMLTHEDAGAREEGRFMAHRVTLTHRPSTLMTDAPGLDIEPVDSTKIGNQIMFFIRGPQPMREGWVPSVHRGVSFNEDGQEETFQLLIDGPRYTVQVLRDRGRAVDVQLTRRASGERTRSTKLGYQVIRNDPRGSNWWHARAAWVGDIDGDGEVDLWTQRQDGHYNKGISHLYLSSIASEGDLVAVVDTSYSMGC